MPSSAVDLELLHARVINFSTLLAMLLNPPGSIDFPEKSSQFLNNVFNLAQRHLARRLVPAIAMGRTCPA